jgi:hypothetical protein
VNISPINDSSPCVVFCAEEGYSEVMGYAAANRLAMRHAAKGHRSHVYRLIEQTMYAGAQAHVSKKVP